MDVPEYIYARLVQAGMTREGAAAVLGNVQHESAFKPDNVEDRSGINDQEYVRRVNSGAMTKQQFMSDTFGFGLAQWTYPPRKGWMWDWFKERGISDQHGGGMAFPEEPGLLEWFFSKTKKG